ncbi:MAG: transposase, partial [Lachnospiraceae bacterium]|nr:transposase [Lachnospiraceae bacterium]
MAQLNITLNQEEIQALLLEDQGEAFKKILQASLNKILQAESAEKLKAEPYERSAERTDSRNGSRDRDLNTRVGRITLQVPRHRNVPFKTLVFENYSRSEAALVAGMAEMVVNGVSTRKVSRVMETLCGTSFSKSAVSDVCKDLDKA